MSQSRIAANLRRWGCHGIDHKNPAHVAAYLLARQQCTRPRPEQVLAIIGKSEVETATTARLSTEFYLVPRANFGGKPPGWLEEFVVHEEELRSNYRVPAHSDFTAVWVVDQACPLTRLGKRVARMSFEQSFTQRMSAEGSAEAPPSPRDEDESAEPPEVAGDTAGVSSGNGSSGAGGSSSDRAGEASAPRALLAQPEGPPSKKQRVLKILNSDDQQPTDELEAQTLEDLIVRIKKAAKAKMLYSEDKTNSATVHFWCLQAVMALKTSGDGAAAGQTPAQMSIIKEHFPGYLLKVLYANRAFNCLKQFVQVLEDLVKCGCKAPCDLPSLRKFAEASLIGEEIPEHTGDLTSKMRFVGSVLYKHFVELRASALESAAKAASDAAKRDALLKAFSSAAESLDDPSGTVLKSANWARSMLTSSVSALARLTFALEAESAQRVEYAASFEKAEVDGVKWSSLGCFVDTVDIPPALEWPQFRDAATLVAKAGLRKSVTNPLVGSVVDFQTEVQAQFAEQAWVPGVLEAASRAKLNAKHWKDVAVPADGIVEADMVLLSRMLGKMFPFRAPEWVTSLREKAAELRQQRKAAEAAAAGEETAKQNKK